MNLVRICADTVSTISSTWQDVVLVNMTTASTYGKLTLPSYVKAEAYIAWDTSGVFDPLESVPTLSIRFSSDPNTILMPVIIK
jgi:hypothetical protein